MRRRIIELGLVIFGVVGVHGQIADTLLSGNRSDSSAKQTREITKAMLKKLDDPDVPSQQDPATRNLFSQQIRDLYRKPTARETAILAPSKKLNDIYADLLSQKRTGIVKLNTDSQCSENTEVVTAAAECSRYNIPGAGTSYSFRFDSYRIPRLADLCPGKRYFKNRREIPGGDNGQSWRRSHRRCHAELKWFEVSGRTQASPRQR